MSSAEKSPLVIVLTTLGAGADAAVFARTLVDERLAACVNVLPPMTSTYSWDGAIEQEREQQIVIKTSAARIEALKARFTTLHPYEVPEFLVLPVAEVSDEYLRWLRESVG